MLWPKKRFTVFLVFLQSLQMEAEALDLSSAKKQKVLYIWCLMNQSLIFCFYVECNCWKANLAYYIWIQLSINDA
jgi:hypothetical protein